LSRQNRRRFRERLFLRPFFLEYQFCNPDSWLHRIVKLTWMTQQSNDKSRTQKLRSNSGAYTLKTAMFDQKTPNTRSKNMWDSVFFNNSVQICLVSMKKSFLTHFIRVPAPFWGFDVFWLGNNQNQLKNAVINMFLAVIEPEEHRFFFRKNTNSSDLSILAVACLDFFQVSGLFWLNLDS
jgi:hypothetical protein